MDTNLLKLFAGHMIVTANLTEGSKYQLLNYIQEASEYQIKVFLLDGEIMNVVEDEFCMEVIDQRLNVSDIPEKVTVFEAEWNQILGEAGGRVAQIRKTVMSTQGAVQSGYLPWVVYRKIRAKYDSCTKKCGTYEFNTARRQFCMAQCKVARMKEEVAEARKTGKADSVKKAQEKLSKAENTLKKYRANFQKRGSEV